MGLQRGKKGPLVYPPPHLRDCYAKSYIRNPTTERYIDAQRPEGVHRGGRLKVGVTIYGTAAVTIDFAVSASPVPTSLVTFLFGDKKVTRPFFQSSTKNA